MILPKKLTNDSECPEDLGLTSGKVCEVCNAFCSPVLLQGVNKTRYEAVQCLQRTGFEAHLYSELRDKPRRMREYEQDVRQPWCNWQVSCRGVNTGVKMYFFPYSVLKHSHGARQLPDLEKTAILCTQAPSPASVA